MISYSQQQSQQQSNQQQPPRFYLNTENGQTSFNAPYQQPNSMRKSQQLETKSSGIKKDPPQSKIIFRKSELLRNNSKEDEDNNEEFHINLYAKSPLSAGKLSQHSAQGLKDFDKVEEKPAKKELQSGISTSIPRQISSSQAQFLQAQLARQEASAASSLIDIQKLKYLSQLEKLLPPGSSSIIADASNTVQIQDTLEDGTVSAPSFTGKSVGQNGNHTANIIANGSNQQSNLINSTIIENGKLCNNQRQVNNISQSNPSNLRIKVAATEGDFGSILAEKMKIIEERKKSAQIENKSTKKESPNARSSSCSSKGKKRMSLKVESRKTRRNFQSKYARSAKSQQRLSMSFDLYSIKESKSEESADGSPLDGYISSSNYKGGFGDRAFFSKGTTSTEQLIPQGDQQNKIINQNYVIPTNESIIKENNIKDCKVENNQIEITQMNQNPNVIYKDNTSENKEVKIIAVLDDQIQKQMNYQAQDNNSQQQALIIKNLANPSKIIQNALSFEMKQSSGNQKQLLTEICQDESSPKESKLINLYRKNENKEIADSTNQIVSEQQQQHQQQPKRDSFVVNGKSSQTHDQCDISISSVNKEQSKIDKSKIISSAASNKPIQPILKKQGSTISLRIDQSPKQDKSENQANPNKIPPHYLELELRQLLPDKPDSNQASLRKSSEVKVIQFSQPVGKGGVQNQQLNRRSSLLDKEEQNKHLPLKTEGYHSGSRDSRNRKSIKDEEDEDQQGRLSKNYDNSPQQINRRSNLQIDSQYDSDKQLLRNSLPQSVSSNANYSSSYRDQFKQRLELQNIRKNPPNYNISVYIAGDKKRENGSIKPDSACSSPITVDKSKSKLNSLHQPIKGTKQIKAASEQSSAKGSSEVSSPKLASRIQSEKNKLSVIALQQKIMLQLGKSGISGNKRITNTENGGEGIIDLHSPSSVHMKSPISLGSDKRAITTIGSSSNLHHLTNGHNSVDTKAKQYDSSGSQATHLTNYDTEPAIESFSKRTPVTFHVSDFTRGNTVLSTASSASGLSESLLSKAQSPQVLSSNKNLNLHRSAKEELEKTVTGLASLKTLPTRMTPAGSKQFPAPTKSEATMKKQLIVRPLVLDDQLQKKKPQINKFNVESKVKNYILAAQQHQSQQKTSPWGQTSSQQQVRDLSNFHISQGISGEHQSLEQICSSSCQMSNKNQINDSLNSSKQYPSTQQKNTLPSQQSQNFSQQQSQQFQTIMSCFNKPSMMQSQSQHQHQQQIQRSDQQSLSLNPSETISTNGGSNQQTAAQNIDHEPMNNSKQRSYLSLQLIQQIFTPAEEAANRQQRQIPRQYSQWST